MAKLPFLRVDKTNLVDESGRRVILKGVALGGWLLMEGYMFCGRNIPERAFREAFEKAAGKEALDDFTRSFRDTFIKESDIRTIKGWGANCVRVPFNYRVAEDEPGYLDRIVGWCEENSLYCILDMHAAPGAQNPDWHADCSGKPDFFANDANKERYLRLWRFLADRYKDSSAVAGYDVLNEPVVKVEDEHLVKGLYEKVTAEIRGIDKRHIIFLEGNMWAERLDFIGKPEDENTACSIHVYPPTDFTFNFVRDLRYPGKVDGIPWNRSTLDKLAQPYRSFVEKNRVHLYVGEFGVNARDGLYGELDWVSDALKIFNDNALSWTYWTYKTVANSVYPDGIYRYLADPAWVNRRGPVCGWETFGSLWQGRKDAMISSWRTENFTLNEKLLAVLKRYFKAK